LDLFPAGRDAADSIRKRIAEARQRGFSITSGSVANGLSGVGVPVLPRTGILQLAISVSAVADSIGIDEAGRFAGIIGQALRELPAAGGTLGGLKPPGP
jgi:DNA-binding IclR family transcriptional regulator